MSFRGGSRRNSEIEPEAVISFLRTLLCLTAGITALTLIGFAYMTFTGQNSIIYQMTLAVNVITLLGGGIMYKVLKEKFRKLEEKKQEHSNPELPELN